MYSSTFKVRLNVRQISKIVIKIICETSQKFMEYTLYTKTQSSTITLANETNLSGSVKIQILIEILQPLGTFSVDKKKLRHIPCTSSKVHNRLLQPTFTRISDTGHFVTDKLRESSNVLYTCCCNIPLRSFRFLTIERMSFRILTIYTITPFHLFPVG